MRPEELSLRTLAESDQLESGEISGVVENALFQGREVHYVVRVGNDTWRVYGGTTAQPGDRVAIGIHSDVAQAVSLIDRTG